jgi:hypothetical protein
MADVHFAPAGRICRPGHGGSDPQHCDGKGIAVVE